MSDFWDATPPAVQPFFRLRQKWRPLGGFGFGLREPAIIGQVRLTLPESLDFAGLDQRMARYIAEKLPAEEAGGEDVALRLVHRATFWAAALQRQAHQPVFGRAYVNGPHPSERGGTAFRLAIPSFAPQATMPALQWVAAAINNFLVGGRLHSVPRDQARQQFAEMIKAMEKFRPFGVNPSRMLAAAHELDIPARQFMPQVLCFGMGARSRLMRSSFTDRTAHLATRFASDKTIAAEVLRRAGLPAPVHARAKSPEEAVTIAHRLGYPVVVKPTDRQQGRGVAANLKSDEAVAAAYEAATRFSKNIIVEKHFEGTDYRMTVLDGKIFRVSARLPGGVIGDGEHSVAELIELSKQSEWQQERTRERGRILIELDAEALQLLSEAGLSPESVLPQGQYQRLRRRGNVSAGGMPMNMKIEDVHPDNTRLAERAAIALRLDLGGVDVILPDVKRSWLETGALLCEVNAQPQVGPPAMPGLLSALLKGDGRIPVLVIVGSGAGLDWQRLAGGAGSGVGFSNAQGIWLGRDQVTGPQRSSFDAGHMIIANPQTEAAIIVMSPAEARDFGLPVDRCDLLVLEGPDNWEGGERERLSELLEIVLPNARRAVYLQPAHSLLVSHRAGGRLEAAASDRLQQICQDFVAAATQSRAEAAPSEPPRAIAG
jgi:cyanophycin synthetase